MMRTAADLTEWLDRQGLGQYAPTFAQNDIECSILADLTDDDLEKLGIASLGHRKKLLKAIEALATAHQPPSTAAAVANATSLLPPPVQHGEVEFRQITVLFIDLVGSTQLSETMHPEDLKEVIVAYRAACSAAVKRFGGDIARLSGDGVMAIFKSHEDDAARAIHAALDIVAGVPMISGPVKLACRVGISSGPVVVGEIGDSGTWSMDALGETPNVAARLQTLAAANAVLISDSTRRLISAAFDCQDLGFRELKGISEPLHVYRVLSAKPTASRFEAAHTGSLTPLIGRSSELSLLLDRWGKAKEGDGQVIFLTGIPGVGKSRLLHELQSAIQREPHFLLHYQGSPYHSQSPLSPVIWQIEQAAQITAREPDADKLAKLDAHLPRSGGRFREQVLLIARLLSIPLENAREFADLTLQQIKNKTISTLIDMLLALAVQRPTLCIFEDAQWIDPTSIELLELIISRINHARVLLIVSCRPEFRPSWINHANTTTLSLTRLSHTEVKTMVRDLLKGGNIPRPLLEQIIEKADGVPLFIEELTSSMLSAPLRTRGTPERMAQPASLRFLTR